MSTDKKEYGISVIIPCYNVGQYVEETLKSVLNQSFKNYEIICLNDGSTDGTLEMLNKYQSLYPYIQVFTGENHGVAYQRNTGVQCAQGKYIYYMDSDDLLKENCLETLYQYAEADNLDVAMDSCVALFMQRATVSEEELREMMHKTTTLSPQKALEYGLIDEIITNDGIYDGRNLYIQMENAGDIKMSVGLQFTCRQFLLDNNIKFGMERYFEDNLYTVKVTLKAGKARCVRDNLYLRRVRANSTMTTSENKTRFESYLEVVRGLMQILEEEKQDFVLQEAIYKRIRGTFMNVYKDYLKVSEEEKEEFFGEKGSPLYLLTGMASFMNIEEVGRKKVSEKLKKTYAEKSEINAKLQRTYAEKSEINAKLKKAYEEKTERGEKLKKLRKHLKDTKAELEEKSKRLEQLEQEKKQLEKHFLGRFVLEKYNK